MFDHDEMKRLRFFEGLRFAVAFAACMAAIAAVAFCCGCTMGPDGIYIDKTVWVYVTNRVDSATGGSEQVGGASSGVAESSSSTVGEAVALDFRYGGFKGGGAKEDSRCRISSLKVSKSGCSLKWESGIPSDWKRGGGGEFVVAAIFYQNGGKWVGGKFDWIDTARKTRDFKNIDSGYNGWDASVFRAAKKHAFCVVSADGRWRSNLIED